MDKDDLKFLNFLESLKTKENEPILESIVKGFTVLAESTQNPDLTGIFGMYNGTPVDISVRIGDVEVEVTPYSRGSRDSLGVPLEPDEGGSELTDYKATATLQPLGKEDYEPIGSPVSIPESEFSKVQIPKLEFSNNDHNRYETNLEDLVTSHINNHIDKWTPDPYYDDPDDDDRHDDRY